MVFFSFSIWGLFDGVNLYGISAAGKKIERVVDQVRLREGISIALSRLNVPLGRKKEIFCSSRRREGEKINFPL